MLTGLSELFSRNGTVDHWQTLIAGLTAWIAALIGGVFIYLQISASKKVENERRRRKFSAARAIFPLTLSNLCDHTTQINVILKALLRTATDDKISKFKQAPTFPTLSPSTVEELGILIEFGENNFSDCLSHLLIKLQINEARLRGEYSKLLEDAEEQTLTTLDIRSSIIDTTEIYAISSSLFEFARRANNSIPAPPKYKEVRSALNLTGFTEDEFPKLYGLAKLYFDTAQVRSQISLGQRLKKIISWERL